VTVRVLSTVDILSMTAMTMASSMGDDEVVVIDIHGVYGMGLPLVKWGLSLSVPGFTGGALTQI